MNNRKKLLAAVLIGMVFMPQIVSAEGKLTVTDKTVVINDGDDSGHFYAKIENDGDTPIGIDNGKLVLFSENDDILETSEYIGAYPSRLILNPGEYTYLSEFLWNSSLKNQKIGDIKFSIGSTDRGKEVISIPCEAVCSIEGSDSYDNYIYVTIKNEDKQIRFGYYVVVALYDTDGKLIYVDQNCYEKIGLHPDSSFTVGMYVDNDSLEYYEANNIEIGSADAIVYFVPEE